MGQPTGAAPDGAATSGYRGGLSAVLVATLIAGVAGYAIQLVAPRLLPTQEAYIGFTVIWSTLYLGVGALSGLQQEVTRAARPAPTATAGGVLARVAGWFGAAIAVICGLGWALALPPFRTTPILWLAVGLGLAGYLLVVLLSGVLYGLRLWPAVALTTITDALVRAALLVPAMALGATLPTIGLLLGPPFLAAFGLTWVLFRRRIRHQVSLDVGATRLASNAAQAVGAAAATGVMISGLPMLIGATSSEIPAALTGALILAITITRAPIVIPVIALQSFLISTVFRDQAGTSSRRLLLSGAVAASAIGLLCLLAWPLGPWIVELISGGQFAITGWQAVIIMASGGLVAVMSVTGPALIAWKRHTRNIVGWVVAAALTVAILALWSSVTGILISLIVPPVVGIVIHATGLRPVPSEQQAWR